LAAHEIKWTDPSVKTALTTLAQLFGQQNLIAGGTSGALAADFPKSVTQVFPAPADRRDGLRGDFVSRSSPPTPRRRSARRQGVPFPAVG